MALAEWLCAHHRRDARAGRIVADMHLHLLPTMNPDGWGPLCVRVVFICCTRLDRMYHKVMRMWHLHLLKI